VSSEIYNHEGDPVVSALGHERHDIAEPTPEPLPPAPGAENTPGESGSPPDGPAPTDQPVREPAPAEERPQASETWSGSPLEPYAVGDPGRAAVEVTAALPDSPHDPADTQLDGGVHGSLVIRAASTRGTSHRHSGTPRQDEYAVCRCGEDWLVAAVADGVSAGALSHLAAALAARGAAEFIRDRLTASPVLESLPWMEMFSDLAGRIVTYGQRRLGNGEPATCTPEDVARSMATTLVVLVLELTPDADEQRRGSVICLGDTSVFRLAQDGGWEPITNVKNAGAAISTSATAALPYLPSNVLEPIPITLSVGEGLFVMTDGVGDPLGTGEGAVGEFLASVWHEPPDLLSFGAQVGFARRSYDDDRTVVGIWDGR
jgi:hypothetical protein